MKSIQLLALLALLVAVGVGRAGTENWTDAQKQVWAVVQSYTEASHQRDAERYLSYWHPDFLGWYNSGHDRESRPTNKAERSSGIEQYFGATRSVEYTLEPMGLLVIANGKAAIVQYRLRNVLESTSSGKKTPGWSHWTDYLVKENGRWFLISDHGGSVIQEE